MTVIDDLLTWEDHALTHIDSVWDAESAQITTVEDIREYIDSLIETYFVGNKELVDPEVWFQLAVMTKHANISLDKDFVWQTLCNKQRDYGSENIVRFGHRGLIVRLHDKVARLENLLDSGRLPENEAVEDTYLDIVGYSTIGLMLLDGSFLKQMAD